ncbi:MAG: acetyltransferase [Flavobacteriales bacterium]|nr:acetyltransferase [Flavobacteriales bacterium]
MKKLIIIGTGDYAEMALRYISRDGEVEVVAFTVERDFLSSDDFQGLPVVPFEDLEEHYPTGDHIVIAGIGPNQVNTIRERLFNEAVVKGYEAFTFISSRANVWSEDSVGEGSFVFDGVTIEPEAVIGKNTVLWSNAVVAHHSTIGDHCFLAPGASVSGRIVVKDNCFLGINCTLRDNITVAEKCIIGGGAVIKKDTRAGEVYSARPADRLDKNSLSTKV